MRKIALLSNITADIVAEKLRKKFDVYIPEGFDLWISDVLNPSSRIYEPDMDAVFVLLDGTWVSSQPDNEVEQKIHLWESAVEKLAGATNAFLFVSTIDFKENRIKTYGERKNYFAWSNGWYQFVQGLSERKRNVYVFDLLQKITDIGRENFYSSKMWYMGSMPYSKTGIGVVVDEITLVIEAAFGNRKKAAVLDLDNTLWGGVIGEDGIDGIVLSDHGEGSRFYNFQQKLLEMKKRGVVLAIDSKNNESDVEAMFDHPSLLLKKDDFVSLKINWNDKASNFKEIEEELNLTESAFVFIDDNPMEREVISGQCMEVCVPEFPKDTVELPAFAERVYRDYFQTLRLTDEDRRKTQMYKEEADRKLFKTDGLDLDKYIKLLEINADIHRMKTEECGRVHQLCSKTNQFNLTTKRYTLKEIEEFASDVNTDIFTVATSDRFGSNGLVGVVIVKKELEDAVIDTFLISCRVMGRKLENVITGLLIRYYGGSYKNLTGKYVRTAKNTPVENLYSSLGFELTADRDSCKEYSYKLDKKYTIIDSYSSIIFEGEKIK